MLGGTIGRDCAHRGRFLHAHADAHRRPADCSPSSIAVLSCRSLIRLKVAVQKSGRGTGASSRCPPRRPAAPNARSITPGESEYSGARRRHSCGS
eukprot:6543990-Prymnesium_polylepis.1